MTYQSVASFHIFHSDNTPAKRTQVLIQTLAHQPYLLDMTDEEGWIHIPFLSPVKRPLGRIFIKGKMVYYGYLDVKKITLSLTLA